MVLQAWFASTAGLASKARKDVKAGTLQLTLRLNHKLPEKLTAT